MTGFLVPEADCRWIGFEGRKRTLSPINAAIFCLLGGSESIDTEHHPVPDSHKQPNKQPQYCESNPLLRKNE